MAQVNKISSFKSFTEVKNQENTMKLRETNNAKRQETVGKIGAILDEMGLTSLSELDEEKKQALISKMFGNVSEDEAEDIEDEINKLGEPKKLEEGNAFIFAASKAKQDGKSEFEFNGKKYKVTIKKDTGLKEGNDFEEVLEEAKRTKFTGKTAHDLYTQTGGKPVTVFVKNDWYSVDPKELKDNKGDSFTGYTKDGSDYGFNLKDIKFIQESVVNEARSIAKIQYDWSKLTTSMQATAQNWKAAEGSAKESLLGKLKEMTAQKKALEAELDATIADKDKDLELVVSESKEADEASNILDDLLDERDGDMEELHGMSMEDALDTVETYGHSGSKAKKIAKELFGMCNESFFRMAKDVISDDLYLATKNLQNFYDRTAAGNDVDTGVIDTIIKALERAKKSTKKFNNKEEVAGTVYEGEVNEAEKFKSTKDFLDFCEEIDGMPEQRIKRIMGKDYIDTPGGFKDEADDYDNDIEEYMISNMGKSDFNELKTWWENNVAESTVTESGYHRSAPSAEATRKAEQLKTLKKLRDHREEQDRIRKAQLKRAKAAGSAKESVVTEAEVKSDDEFKEYAMAVLKKAFGEEFDEAKAGEVVDGILKKCGDDYGAAVGMLTSSLGESVVTEAFDANYWEDYQEGAQKMKNPTAMQIMQDVEAAVEDWNDNNEMGKENEVTSAGEKKVLKLAKEFAKAKGWISFDVIDAMIAQES